MASATGPPRSAVPSSTTSAPAGVSPFPRPAASSPPGSSRPAGRQPVARGSPELGRAGARRQRGRPRGPRDLAPSGSPRRGRRGPFETTVAPSYVQDKSTSAPDGGVAAACFPAPPPPSPTTARPAAAAGRQAPAFGATGLVSRPPGRPAPPRSSPTSAGRRTVAAARAGR